MKKTALVLALVIIASCLCVLLTGCGAGNELIGTWEYENGIITFKSDGSCTVTNDFGYTLLYGYEIIGDDVIELIYYDKECLKYKVEGDKLFLYELDGGLYDVITRKK